MELDKIKEVREHHNTDRVNQFLKEGWILLDTKVVQVTKPDGVSTGEGRYILGRPEEK